MTDRQARAVANPARERQAVLCALAAVALWSTVATGFKLGLDGMSPLQLVFAGTLVSLAVFWSAALWTGRYRLGRARLFGALALGLINPFAYYVVLFSAYARLPAQVAQPINYTWAIVLALLAAPILGHKLTRRAVAGILVSYCGVVVVLTQGRLALEPHIDWLGVAFALASTLLWAVYWLAATRFRAEPIATMAWSFLFAAPAVALACLLGPGWPALDAHTFVYGTWVGLLEMGVTFLLWQRALRLTSNAGRIGQLIFLSPFVSLVLIGTVLGETIHPTSVIGLAIIVAGLALAREGRAHRGA